MQMDVAQPMETVGAGDDELVMDQSAYHMYHQFQTSKSYSSAPASLIERQT